MDTRQRELYNLKEDPQELNNLFKSEKTIAHELEQRLFNWLESMGQDEYYYKKLLKDVLRIKEY
jgi:hypothetical protein